MAKLGVIEKHMFDTLVSVKRIPHGHHDGYVFIIGDEKSRANGKGIV